MKKVLVALLLTISASAFSQTATDSLPQSSTHTDSSLSLLSKMKLTEIYLKQIETLAMSLPYAAFTLDRPDSTVSQLDLPESNYLAQKRKKVLTTSETYSKVLRDKMYEIVPYSDKKDIIAAILFVQRINSSMR